MSGERAADDPKVVEYRERVKARSAERRQQSATPEAIQARQDAVEAHVRDLAERIAPQLAERPDLLTELVFEMLMIGDDGRMAGGFAAMAQMSHLPEDHFLRKLAARASHLHRGTGPIATPRLGDLIVELAD